MPRDPSSTAPTSASTSPSMFGATTTSNWRGFATSWKPALSTSRTSSVTPHRSAMRSARSHQRALTSGMPPRFTTTARRPLRRVASVAATSTMRSTCRASYAHSWNATRPAVAPAERAAVEPADVLTHDQHVGAREPIAGDDHGVGERRRRPDRNDLAVQVEPRAQVVDEAPAHRPAEHRAARGEHRVPERRNLGRRPASRAARDGVSTTRTSKRRPVAPATASSTSSAAGTTSGPMPSPTRAAHDGAATARTGGVPGMDSIHRARLARSNGRVVMASPRRCGRTTRAPRARPSQSRARCG
jgi:hypothetical protein